jgi:hypothetical protein
MKATFLYLAMALLLASTVQGDVDLSQTEQLSRLQVAAPIEQERLEHNGWSVNKKRATSDTSIQFFVKLRFSSTPV